MRSAATSAASRGTTPHRRGVRRGDAIPFVLAALVFGVVFAGVTWVVVSDPDAVTPLDEQVGAAVIDLGAAQPWLPRAAEVLDLLGGGPFCTLVVTLVVVLLLLRRRPYALAVSAYLVLSALGGAAVNALVKGLIERPRPPWVGLYVEESTSSYPSGHAMAGITVYVALAAIALLRLRGPWRWPVGIALLAFGPLVGVSRVVVGVHWPTDVLGGWTLGAMWTSVAAAVVVLAMASRRAEDAGPRPDE